MYNEDATALPRDDDHFWEMVEDNFEFARHVLEDYPLETRQEALEHGRKPAFHVLAYRGTSEEMDQRDYYYEMGNSLLSDVRTLIERRELSLEFVQQWGKLMFCHGMLATYVFDDADPLAAARGAHESAKARSPEKHRRWLAHVFGMKRFAVRGRSKVDHEVGVFLHQLRNDPRQAHQYPEGWFDRILTRSGELRPTYQSKNFKLKDMPALRGQDASDLPPIPKDS